MSRRTLRAVAVTEPGAVATEVLPQKDDTLLWAKCKYRMCLACYPDHKSRDGIAMFMRQRFFNPENCEESDLHPLVFPPPLSQVVVYGPVLFVSMKNDTVGPLALAAWKAAWQQMRTHSWVTADAHNEHTKPCELCEDRDEEDEDISDQEYSESDIDEDEDQSSSAEDGISSEEEEEGNTTETSSGAEEDEDAEVVGGADIIQDDYAPPPPSGGAP